MLPVYFNGLTYICVVWLLVVSVLGLYNGLVCALTGFQMLQKLGWKEGQGLGFGGSGILDPVNKCVRYTVAAIERW